MRVPTRRVWRPAVAWAAAICSVLQLLGCASDRPDVRWPEPRPLGRELPTTGSEVAPDATEDALPPTDAAEHRGPLTLRKAMAHALLGNPTFQASSWEVRAADARRLQEGLRPNPELDMEVEELSGDNRGLKESETSVVLSQAILLGGKRAKRTRVAELERDVAGWEYEIQRLNVLTEVAKAFVSALGTQRKVELAKETVRIAEEASGAASDRVSAGAASPVEQTRAQVALATARNGLLRAEQELRAAKIRLAATWGATAPQVPDLEGELDVDLPLPDLDSLIRRLAQNPELMRAGVALMQRRAALDLAKSRRIPDLTVSAGYQRIEGDDANTFTGGVSLPLPIFDRNQGGIREARANLRKSQWEQEAAKTQVRAALATAHSALAAAVRQREVFKNEILPGAQATFEAVREGYRQGTFDYLDFLTAQQNLAETRIEYVNVLVALHEAAADVERLIGEPIAEHTKGAGEKE